MKIKIIYTAVLFSVCFLLASCQKEELDANSVIPPAITNNEFDTWLLKNYTYPYNIELKYRLEDIEADPQYNVVPADKALSIKMAKVMKHLWFEAYDEVAGIDFTRSYSPRVIHFIGSAAWDDNLMTLGTAEGGIKITLTLINGIDPTDLDLMNQNYFGTLHHEFAHILHQTIPYPQEFNLISAGSYSSSGWFNLTLEEYASQGFVTAYSAREFQEDFVEIIANYIIKTDAEWNVILTAAGPKGQALIAQKLAICKSYMLDVWKVDLDKLREVVKRRSNELQYIDLDNL